MRWGLLGVVLSSLSVGEASAPKYTGAKYEPVSGCYLGVFLEHETIRTGKKIHVKGGPLTFRFGKTVHTVQMASGDIDERFVAEPQNFAKAVGKQHAIYFSYFRYGFRDSDVIRFVQRMKKEGRGAQVALEPASLNKVQDDQVLHRLATILRDAKIPIFLRFASEMNGSWVPYSGNPALYKEKFRLVARVMHKEAPNVAMVWCPSSTPERPIPSYFPGDDAVDWVGVNFYAVPDLKNPGKKVANPADSLAYVYNRYAARHPIMICEWGASHHSVASKNEWSDFAASQICRLYATLPRQYPRVKSVNWLSMNAIQNGNPGQQSNDYSLLDNDQVRAAYAKAIRDPYYLTDVR